MGHVKIVKKLQENYEDKFLKIKENSLYLNRIERVVKLWNDVEKGKG